MESNNKARARENALERCREKGIIIPTLEHMRNPETLDPKIYDLLKKIDPQAVDPLNLFRITWHNDPVTGGFGPVDFIEIPSELSGVNARIIGMVGKHFPTGAHKVGAAFGCLVPELISGGFDPINNKAVWPSTGNYCRGGAFDSALLGCRAVAILPEEMSRERFEWLENIGAQVIATPGCESNVKEIFDACHEIRKDPKAIIFNQFEQFGNYLWHYGVTGPAAQSVFENSARPGDRFAGWVSATGSAGTLAAGDYLKDKFPGLLITATEALQCPTLLQTGFGAHRIEGIGDKHVPWIHNARNTDMVVAVDDQDTMSLLRLFNEASGKEALSKRGIEENVIKRLPLLGISSICNLLAAIKQARYFDLDENDILMTPFTDSVDLYQSRLIELNEQMGPYNEPQAFIDFERRILGAGIDYLKELTYPEKKSIHNLKYFTWVEQQGRTVEEMDALWTRSFWQDLRDQLIQWDPMIDKFNLDSGVSIDTK